MRGPGAIRATRTACSPPTPTSSTRTCSPSSGPELRREATAVASPTQEKIDACNAFNRYTGAADKFHLPDRAAGTHAGPDGDPSRRAQRRAGAWRLGRRLKLEQGDPAAPGRRAQRHLGAEFARLARAGGRRRAPRAGRAEWTDRAGGPFVERHRSERRRRRSQGIRAGLCCRAGTRCRRRLSDAATALSQHACARRDRDDGWIHDLVAVRVPR